MLLMCTGAMAQSSSKTRISWETFLNTVMQHPDIANEREKVDLTKLDIDVVKIKPDPELEFGNACGDISGINMAQQWYVGVSYTIETAGKRKSRIQYAQSAAKLEEAEFELFVLDFAKSALKQYYQCWMLEQKITQMRSYFPLFPSLKKSPTVDSMAYLRHLVLIEHTKLLLTDLEHQYEEEVKELQQFVDYQFPDVTVLPDSALNLEYIFSNDEVNQKYVLKNHAELKVKNCMEQMASNQLILAQRNRISDVSFSLGNNFIAKATNPEAPSPAYNAITATFSIPIKFSNLNKSDLKIIEYNKLAAIEQSRNAWDEKDKELTELKTQLRYQDTKLKHVRMLIIHQTELLDKIGKVNPLLFEEEYQELKHYHQIYWESTEKLIGMHLDISFLSGQYEKMLTPTVAGVSTD